MKIYDQCDQMAALIVQYMDIYDNENLPKKLKIAKVGLKLWQAVNDH